MVFGYFVMGFVFPNVEPPFPIRFCVKHKFVLVLHQSYCCFFYKNFLLHIILDRHPIFDRKPVAKAFVAGEVIEKYLDFVKLRQGKGVGVNIVGGFVEVPAVIA